MVNKRQTNRNLGNSMIVRTCLQSVNLIGENARGKMCNKGSIDSIVRYDCDNYSGARYINI